LLEGFEEGCGALLDGDFGLDNQLLPGHQGQDFAELHLGGAIGAGGFDVGDAEIESASDGGFEVLLVGFGYVLFGDVLPTVLVAHAAAGEDGHLEVGTTEAAIKHDKAGNRRLSHFLW
jgi:hypothetical protein